MKFTSTTTNGTNLAERPSTQLDAVVFVVAGFFGTGDINARCARASKSQVQEIGPIVKASRQRGSRA